MWDVIVLLAAGVLAAGLASLVVQRLTVFEYQHAILYYRGRFDRLLAPGVYWLFKPNQRVEVLDARPKVITVPGQEVLSADGVSLKVSVLVEFRVADPKRALARESYQDSLYAHVQAALREVVGNKPMQELLEARAEIGEHLSAQTEKVADALGLDVQAVSVKDIMLPGSLKDAFSQVARARQDGLASLERARGESAAMRSLANTAKLLDANPALYQLRLLQTVGSAGNVVIHVGGDGEKATSVS